MKLFDAFKQYIVKHPKVAAYKPTSETPGQVPVSRKKELSCK